MKKFATLVLAAGLAVLSAMAQNVTLKGVVLDSAGEPVIGAFVVEQGTQNGTMTGVDGDFSVSTRRGASVEVSCIGYATQVIVNNGEQNLKVILQDDTQMLEETVVIGYGVQKKSVVTAAIAKVDSEVLGATAPVRVDNALKGLAAGVTVTSSSGQPGAQSRVRVRGTGTVNNSDPLYIIDGMPFNSGDALDFLNPNDIESIEVLKDAASGAVYGARAANGVILVTTKKGVKGDAQINYNFSYGLSSPWREREVLNASEYALMINEGHINGGQAPVFNDPWAYGTGTNWQHELFNYNAPQSNHELSVSGATDKVNYYVSAGYLDQEGIVGGNYGRSNYRRLSLRSNTSYTLFDRSAERTFLNKLTFGSNLSYANIRSTGVETNSAYGSLLGSAIALSPILSVYADENTAASQIALYGADKMVYSKDGRMFTIPGANFNEMVNPLASLSLPATPGWNHKFVAGFNGELQIWDNLKFRSSLGLDLSFYGNEGYTIPYYLAENVKDPGFTSASMYTGQTLVWQIENILTYDKAFGHHSFSALVGQSAKASSGQYMSGDARNLKSYDRPYIDYTNSIREDGDMAIHGAPYASSRLASYFFRGSYNYAERYMAQVTVRYDGSSRFGSLNHWALFPSFSLGWNLHNEPWINLPQWLSMSKLRFSWGKNGNENIGDFGYTTLTAGGNNYIIGTPLTGEKLALGVKASGIANQGLRWEESVQTDIGLDLAFLNSALTFSVDYFDKTTNGMLMEMNIPLYVGETRPIGNVGIMRNYGVEMEAGFKQVIGDVNFRLNGNLTWLRNVLVEYGNESGSGNLDSFQGSGTISRAENGKPFPFFYGYKTDGIFQNQAEIDAYVNKDGEKLLPNAVPGDVRFVDVNGDGVFNDLDRTDIGNGTPDWTYGLNFSLGWKGLDFSMLWQGTLGNDVFDATRRTDVRMTNLPSYMLNRWTGEGTSTRIPRFVIGDNSSNWQSSDLYVYDGSYLRLKNIQLGYTLPSKLTSKVFIQSLRLYVAAENLFTFTKYHGYDPEISSGGTSLGIDYGVYPQARTFTFGVNVKLGRTANK